VTYFLLEDAPEKIANTIADYLSVSPLFQMRAKVREQYTWEGIYRRNIVPLLMG
jgi:hypothetical protein